MALVLTLKRGDFIFVGPDITIAVLPKKGGGMRIAIEAPKEIEVATSNFFKRKLKQQELKE